MIRTSSTLSLVVLCLGLGVTLKALAGRPEPDAFTTIDVPGASSTQAIGINGCGDIVGFYVSDGVQHGFLLSDDSFATIDVPGASLTQPTAINPRGDIVGFYVSDGVAHGFLFSDDSFTTIDIPDASLILSAALGINPRGDIVGVYRIAGESVAHGYLLSRGEFASFD